MRIEVDRTSPLPLRDQISDALRRDIDRGTLAAGTRLPSSRDLARAVGVNRTTIVESYRALVAEGRLEAGVGRGTFVRGTAPLPGPSSERKAPFSWARLLGSRHRRLATAPEEHGNANAIPLQRAVLHPDLFAVEALGDALARASTTLGRDLLDYAPPAGYPPLRRVLAKRFAARGVDPEKNEVLIVNGSQQGLDLVARLLLRDGAGVALSRPTFSGALDVFRWHGASLLPVPLDAEGMEVDALDALARRRRPRLIYTIPRCHNPTGVTASEQRRAGILGVAARGGIPVLEDDWLADLAAPDGPSPLKAQDEDGRVIALGTCSKVLAPGLRVGWMVVPKPIFPALLTLKSRADLCTNLPGQAVLHELLAGGAYDAHVARVRVELAARRQLVDDAIDASFPESVRPLRPHDGLVCWLPFPWQVDEARLLAAARDAGLDLAPGSPFEPMGRGLPGLRLSYATAARDDLVPAIHTLGGLVEEALARGPAAAGPPLV